MVQHGVLIALLLMKILLTITNYFKYGLYYYFFISIIRAIFYLYNEFYRLTIDFVPVGFTKCVPFIFWDIFLRQKNYLPTTILKHDWLMCIISITISFVVYLLFRNNLNIINYGLYLGTVCLFAIWGFFCLCRILDNIHSHYILNISLGTIVIMGLHGILITLFNFILSTTLNVSNIVYPWYIAILLSIIIVFLFYP